MNISRAISNRLLTISNLLLLMTALTLAVHAQTSSVDLTFNAVPAKNAAGSQVNFILQPDNKILVFGSFQIINGAVSNQIARLNPDGSPDNTFSCTTCDFSVTSALLQPDGKIIITGGPVTHAKIIRLNTDGSLDTGFTSPYQPVTVPFEKHNVTVRGVQADGKVVVIFRREISPDNYSYNLTRLNADGSIDDTYSAANLGGAFGGSFQQTPGKVSTELNDKTFVAINKTCGACAAQNSTLGRYNADGTVDATFEQVSASYTRIPPTDFGHAITNDYDAASDGSVIMAGKFSAVNAVARQNIAKIMPAGNVDLTFNATGLPVLTGVRLVSGGKVLVSTATGFFRLNSDGSPDNTFNAPTNLGTIIKWSLDSTGRVVFNTLNMFGRLNDDGSLESSFAINFGIPGTTTAIATQSDGKIVFIGDFVSVNGVTRTSMARVNADGTLDTTFNAGNGPSSTVTPKIIVQPDGKVLVTGNFNAFNSVARPSIARLNADGSLDLLFNPTVATFTIKTMALQPDGKILIGGSFAAVNGETRTGLARLNSDGGLDTAFNPTFGSPTILSITLQANGQIMVGGSFNGVSGFNRKNMVRLNTDGSVDSTFNNLNGTINTFGPPQIEALADGKYLVLANNQIIRLAGDGATDTSFVSPVLSTSGTINQFLAQPDGTTIFGGNFSSVNGVARLNIARVKPYGALDTAFLPAGANSQVRAITRQADGKVLAGGDFSVIGNVTRMAIARLNVSVFQARTPFDFDGDGRADIAVFRPSSGDWYELRSQSGSYNVFHWGQAGDRLSPVDYDGDGRADVAVFRDTVPGAGDLAYFYITNSVDNSITVAQFGSTGDVPVSGDWDGDGKADLAVYRDGAAAGGQSYFYYRPSGSPGVNFNAIPWGATGDKPLVGDFDGDARLDAAVFRPSIANWYILNSSNGQFSHHAFGLSTDIPTPADFDGDGRTNIAVFRPSTGFWYTSMDPQTNYGGVGFGLDGDVPAAADYDGDGKADVAVFRPSNGLWYVLRSTQGFTAVNFGIVGDKPIPNAFVP